MRAQSTSRIQSSHETLVTVYGFSPFDWITCEVGSLYCPPFMSRRLLFRLLHDHCSLMVYHNENITSRLSRHWESEKGSSVHVTSVHTPIKTISVHFAESATMSSKEILALPAMDFPFRKELRLEKSFGGIKIRISPCPVKNTGHFIPRPPHTGLRVYRIGDRSYQIRRPGELVRMADRWAPEHEFSTLKVSIVSSDGEEYGLFQERPWSVIAPGWGRSFFDGDPFVLWQSSAQRESCDETYFVALDSDIVLLRQLQTPGGHDPHDFKNFCLLRPRNKL